MKKVFVLLILIALIVGFFIIYFYLSCIFNLPKEEDNNEEDDEISHQNPCWSPNGYQLLFSNTEGSGSLNIWIMNNDSSNARPLLFNGAVDAEADYVHLPGGAWSKVTNQICFSSDRVDNDEIWYLSEDFFTLNRVTNNPAKDWEPSWSPDGEWIVFQSDRTGNWDLFKIRKDGTGLEQLTDDPANDWLPNWSPDGEKIIFQSDRSGNWQLYTIDNFSIESNLQNLSNNPSFEDTDASWNPDGQWIVFSSDRAGNDADLYIMKNDGTQIIQITNHPAYDGAPAWAPNNNTIAFESERSGELRIWTVNLSTFLVSQLTH